MTPEEPALDLSVIPLLQGVDAELLAEITPGMVRTHGDGEHLIHQGDNPSELIVILRNQVEILADGVFLVSRGPFELIGEQAFLNKTTRNASARARGPVKALHLPAPLVTRLLEDARFATNLLSIVSDKLTEATLERAWRYDIQNRLYAEFQAHVSPKVTQDLLAKGSSYGKPRHIDATILFADIREFTARSRGMEPMRIAAELSVYFDVVVSLVHSHGGLVDKFMGDGVLAVWGFLPSEGDSAHLALTCGKQLVMKARTLQFGGETIKIGVGIESGTVFIGNVGNDDKKQFTVIGTPVNLAARYQDLCKTLNVPIVLGPSSVERLPEGERKRLESYPNQEIRGFGSQAVAGLRI